MVEVNEFDRPDAYRCLDCEALLPDLTSIKRGTCDECENYWGEILHNHKTIKKWREQQ
jgi:hypothetical protein